MAVEVKLPRLGQGMEAGTIVRWLKSEGDAVTKGEALYELDTDKVTQEVEAEAEGVLLKIVVSEGEVDVGTTVGVIGAEGEEVAVEAPRTATRLVSKCHKVMTQRPREALLPIRRRGRRASA